PAALSGHPISHSFERSVPTSTCITCHVHPGTNVLNSYLGFTWWDNETEGKFLYPKDQHDPTPDEEFAANQHNPEGSAARGLWGAWTREKSGLVSKAGEPVGKDFLADLTSL